MTRLPTSLLVILTTSLGAANAQSAPEANGAVLLAHNLADGTRFDYSLEITSDVSLNDDKQNVTMFFSMHFDAAVEQPKTGTRKATPVSHRLTRLQTRTKSLRATTEYDSDAPRKETGTPGPMALLLNETITTQIDPTGQIHSITLPKKLTQDVEGVRADDFTNLFQLYFLRLPSKPVRVGDTWQTRMQLIDVQLATDSSAEVTNRLEAINGNLARISHHVELPTPHRSGIDFKLQETSGQTVFDLQSGRVVESSMTLVARASKNVGEGEKIAGTSSLRITLKSPGTSSAKADR